MAQMEEAEMLTYQGKVLATWITPKQSYYLDGKRLEAERPELIPQYQVPIQNSLRLVIKELSHSDLINAANEGSHQGGRA